MKIDIRWILPLALGIALAVPSSMWAQGRGNANGHGKNKDRGQPTRVIVLDDDRDDDDDRDWNRGRNDRRGDTIVLRDGSRTIVLDRDDFAWFPVRNDGPAFCRSGAGHPVWGLQWCLNKGYAVGRPGAWFLRDDDLFFRDQTRVIVLRDRAYDADRAFWGAVVSQVLAWVD
jgi:hypothetical protein